MCGGVWRCVGGVWCVGGMWRCVGGVWCVEVCVHYQEVCRRCVEVCTLPGGVWSGRAAEPKGDGPHTPSQGQ